MTPRQLDALAAWWHAGSVRGAAALLGIAEQTAKNELLAARRGSGVESNVALVKSAWRDVAKALERLGLMQGDAVRRLRYRFDAAYQERHRNQSRAGMQRLRAKRRSTSHNDEGEAA